MLKGWLFTLVLLFQFLVFAQENQSNCSLALQIYGVIGASTFDYISRGLEVAQQKKCESIYLRVNTPGGSLESTRLIVEKILSSPIPFLCLITPAGGHAGSAGAILLQACHINGGVKTTNIGAATPILGTGGETPSDLRKKMINDSVSWLEGVTKLRNRNLTFSKEIITEAKSFTSEEAQKMGALDFVTQNETEFINLCKTREIKMNDKTLTLNDIQLVEFVPDWRYKILNFFADPEIAYMIFMASLALLYVEFTNPGLIAPGVVGGIGLVMALVSFHKLDVSWGGVLLLFLGVAFLIAEMFVPSFGALGIGGIVSLVLGSLFLFDADKTGISLSLSVILPMVFLFAAVFLSLGWLALKTFKQKRKDSDEELLSQVGTVVKVLPVNGEFKGQLEVAGETWNFVSLDKLSNGDQVKILKRNALELSVKKIN